MKKLESIPLIYYYSKQKKGQFAVIFYCINCLRKWLSLLGGPDTLKTIRMDRYEAYLHNALIGSTNNL